MKQETKTCQSCRRSFVIEPEDFDFYKKINIPPPTWCPECRMQRRFTWRNERTLYKRKCNAPGHSEEMISIYSPDKPFTVYDEKYWWSDAWDPMDYGSNYVFSKPFFQQYRDLLERVPLIGVSVTNMSNCQYCNVSEGDKDSYYLSASWRNEHSLYANRIVHTKDSLDLYISDSNELCYDCVSCKQNYRLFFSVNCVGCSESAFLSDCVGCQNCFGCTNLRNKQFYIFNQPYSKEDYIKKKKDFDLGSFDKLGNISNVYNGLVIKSIHRFANLTKCVNTTGDNCINTKNCYNCFDIFGDPSGENDKYCAWGGYGMNDSYDCGPGIGGGELLYETFDTNYPSRVFFSGVVYDCQDTRYSINCHSSGNLFGCYGLRNKQYCILNRQYSKEEYEILINKVVEHMNNQPYFDKEGRIYKYGEFFPAELSPFAYNESIAQDYFNVTSEEAADKGFIWYDKDKTARQITLTPKNIPDHIKDIPDTITGEIIGCGHGGTCTHKCTGAFRIVSEELQLYRKLGIAVPHLCPNCRHHGKLAKRNPLKLWHRTCQCAGQKSENGVYTNTIRHQHGEGKCPNEFETSYAPERPEIVYCESCYNSEVV